VKKLELLLLSAEQVVANAHPCDERSSFDVLRDQWLAISDFLSLVG
jgi:hypothetical protein